MKKLFSALLLTFLSFTSLTAMADGHSKAEKYYLFIGKLDQPATAALIKHAGDTFPGYAEEVRKMGGKLHSYYFAVKEPTMYAVISLPSHKEAAAQVYQRRGFNGIIREIELIELFTSEQMVDVWKLAGEYTETLIERVKEAGINTK